MSEHWRDIYHANRPSGSYRHNANEVAQRSLKNLALRYLSNAQTEDSLSLVQAQFSEADNMTDRLAALGILVNDPRPEAAVMAIKALEMATGAQRLQLNQLMNSSTVNEAEKISTVMDIFASLNIKALAIAAKENYQQKIGDYQ